MIFLEERGEAVGVVPVVVVIRVFEGEGPAELEVSPVCFAEGGGLEVLGVVLDESVAQAGPGEEVDGDGVFESPLRGPRSLPVGEVEEICAIGVEIEFHESVAFDGKGDSADFVF